MKKLVNLAVMAILAGFSTSAQTTAEEVMPFLKGEYVYEYLREAKAMMNGSVVSETRTETTYDDNNHITKILVTTNGQPTLETTDFNYGNRTMSNVSNSYMNGQKLSTTKTSNQYADDFYRNTSIAEIETEGFGNTTKQRNEWSYDEQGRIIGMKQFQDGQLQKEQKDYVWTPNSCEYVEISYFPIASTQKVTKKFQDENYVQNILEVHEIDMNGVKMENKNEYTYDPDGNLTSMKSFSNGQLTMEWKDYKWGDKKNTHTEVMYMNGTPSMTTEVTQYYK